MIVIKINQIVGSWIRSTAERINSSRARRRHSAVRSVVEPATPYAPLMAKSISVHPL